LCGRSILVVEDEPLIALDIVDALKPTGANVITAGRLSHALKLAESTDLSGVVLGYKIGDADSGKLCSLLKERGIPFLFYTGYDVVQHQWPDVTLIQKPATQRRLVTALEALVAGDASARNEATKVPPGLLAHG
jgi:DNA-binding response OmpR family regulator